MTNRIQKDSSASLDQRIYSDPSNSINQRAFSNYDAHYKQFHQDLVPLTWSKSIVAGYERTWGRFIPSHGDTHVLDLGCGSGILLRWLTEFHPNTVLHGVDRSPELTEIAIQSFPMAQISCCDAIEYLSNKSSFFEIVFAMDVLEHIPKGEPVRLFLDRIRSSLKPGGRFICRVPNAANILAAHSLYLDLTHEWIYTSSSLLQLLRAVDFQDPEIIPIRGGSLLKRFRNTNEYLLHRLLFCASARFEERHFSRNISATGTKLA